VVGTIGKCEKLGEFQRPAEFNDEESIHEGQPEAQHKRREAANLFTNAATACPTTMI
jgi:hypothetical protein